MVTTGRSGEPEAAPPADWPGLVVLAVDDEAPALDEIAFLLRRDPRVATVLTAHDAAAAVAVLQPSADHPAPDAVLLDIAMPGWDGVQLARVLGGLPNPPPVAFLSAHDDRAVDAFEIGAVDYLLKPVRAGRLAEAVSRLAAARDRAGRGGTGGDPPDPDRVPAVASGGASGEPTMIAVELAGTTTFVSRSEVCWAEAQGDYARLHMAGGGSHLLRTPLTVLQTEWEQAGFVRVHRSYLVALQRIVEMRTEDGGHRIRVSGQPVTADLPVSRRQVRMLRQRLLAGRRPGR